MKMAKTLLPIIAITISIVAIIISSIALSSKDNNKILDAYQIGLGDFFNDEITKMYIDEGNDPNRRTEFINDNILEKMQSLLKTGIFQKAKELKSKKAPGAGIFAYISFTTNKAVYSFSVVSDMLRVTINSETMYFNSNVRYSISQLIAEALNIVFAE